MAEWGKGRSGWTPHFYHANADLVGLHAIDKWVEERRDKQVKARKEDTDPWEDVRAKSVCEEGE